NGHVNRRATGSTNRKAWFELFQLLLTDSLDPEQLVEGMTGAALHDPPRERRTHSGQAFQLLLGRGVDVDLADGSQAGIEGRSPVRGRLHVVPGCSPALPGQPLGERPDKVIVGQSILVMTAVHGRCAE